MMNRILEKCLKLSNPSFKKIRTSNRTFSIDTSTDLKSILAAQIPKEIDRIKNFRKQYGTTKINDITVDMVISKG